MELRQQLEKWQLQVAEADEGAVADMDVANRLLKHGLDALDEIDLMRANLRPEWGEDGQAKTLAAAAEDADEWLALIENLNNDGHGSWKFSQPDNLAKLRGCREALRWFLTPNK